MLANGSGSGVVPAERSVILTQSRLTHGHRSRDLPRYLARMRAHLGGRKLSGDPMAEARYLTEFVAQSANTLILLFATILPRAGPGFPPRSELPIGTRF